MTDDYPPVYNKDDYSHGAIMKLIFHNFLTYQDVECVPGPYMNVITGPNGTGKSTIICGICLASGGSPKLLGRSDNKGDFIKHGKSDGYVEMYLRDTKTKDGVKVFKIQLRQPNTAAYFINGKKVTLADVTAEISKFNIQVDNPCTFLAQDKVKSFAEQDSKGLLINTMKAGPHDLMEIHSELMNKAKTKDEHGEKMKKINDDYNRLLDDIKKTRERAEKYQERQQANKRLQAFRGKLAYLKVDTALKEYETKKVAIEEAKQAYKVVEKTKAPIEQKLSENNAKKRNIQINSKIQSEITQMKVTLRDCCNELKDSFNNNEVQSARREFADVKQKYQNWDKEVKRLEGIVTSSEKTEAEIKEKNKIDEGPLKSKKLEYEDYRKNLEKDERTLEAEHRKAVLNKQEIQKNNEQISESFITKFRNLPLRDDSLAAWNFYMDNRNRFRYPVFVPILFMKIHQRYHRQLSNVLGLRDASIFIFGCEEDENLILQRYKVNTTVMSSEFVEQHGEKTQMPSSLRKLGFDDYVINVFETVKPVRAYLSSVLRWNTVPIGGEIVDRESEKIGYELASQIGLFLTNRNRVEISVSRYDQTRITVSRQPFHPRIIFCQLHEMDFEDNQIEKIEEINRILSDIDKKRKILNERKPKLEQLKDEFQRLTMDIQRQKDAVDTAMELTRKAKLAVKNYILTKPNIEAAKLALLEIEKKQADKTPKILEQIIKNIKSTLIMYRNCVLESAELKRLNIVVELLRNKLENIQEESKELENRYKNLQIEEKELKNHLQFLKDQLKESMGCSSSKIEELENNEKNAWNEMQEKFRKFEVPDDEKEIEEEIRQIETMQDARTKDGTREDVIRLSELEKKETKEREEKRKFEESTMNWERDMQDLIDRWITPLEDFINKISNNFGSYFKKINCAGEVCLHKPDNPLDIEEYGVDIFVQFKGYNKMRKLTAQQQSGGERSVSTMLYLMALQELCPVPFRCVDEINQGMDPNNEKIVFNMMVKLLSGDEGELAHSQYFILTPKLLPGLDFNEKVTVLIIQNSPMMSDNPGVLRVEGTEIVV